jgi:hypothetical protein
MSEISSGEEERGWRSLLEFFTSSSARIYKFSVTLPQKKYQWRILLENTTRQAHGMGSETSIEELGYTCDTEADLKHQVAGECEPHSKRPPVQREGQESKEQCHQTERLSLSGPSPVWPYGTDRI